MFGGTRSYGSAGAAVGVAALALAVGLAGCSSDDGGAKVARRRCEVVTADDLSDLTGAKLTLGKATKDPSVCRFRSSDERTEVRLTIEGPVEAGQAALTMTTPRPVAKLGDEAWSTTQNAPLDAELVVRKAGTLLIVDVADESRGPQARIALATKIARAALPHLPVMKLKEPSGPRGEAACQRFETKAVQALVGGVVVVTPSAPVGSCRLTAAALSRTIDVSVLIETGATRQQLDGFVAGVDSEVATTVGDRPGYWIPSPSGAGNGGQLDLLDDGRILQVSVIGVELPEGKAQALATSIAEIAVKPA
jgi:hypothetical protein